MVKATPKSQPSPYTYANAGVDIKAGNDLVDAIKDLAASTRRPGADSNLGGFGGIFDLNALGMSDPLLVAATDGVGTKLRLAIDHNRHDTIGVDLVAMCVNDLIVQGATPLFFLDYLATGKLEPPVARDIVSGVAHGCRQAGCALIGGETAEMPGHYAGKDYDLAGFSVGAVERDKLLPRTNDLAAGDVLIGVRSSGLHSNGYSLVRKLLDDFDVDPSAPFEGETLLDTLLTPTKIYAKPLLGMMAQSQFKAAAHVTGGGLTENVPRVLPAHLDAQIDLAAIKPPPIFGWLAATGKISEQEMLRTFNCGIGMVLVVAADLAPSVVSTLHADGEDAHIVGQLVANNDGAPSMTAYVGTIDFQQAGHV